MHGRKLKKMTANKTIQVTLLLNRWQAGDKLALDSLIPLVYQELRGLAKAQLLRNNNSIQCTELVSEAYMRLVDTQNIDYNDRTHFFSMAARTMRRVLVDKFRQKNANKRGNNPTFLTFMEGSTSDSSESSETIKLDELEEALIKLEKLDATQAEIVTLRFFGGLKSQEIAKVLDISTRTIRREWAMARIWLHRQLN
jgi:RNA polymerase sigma factor (TIGR02999 family)